MSFMKSGWPSVLIFHLQYYFIVLYYQTIVSPRLRNCKIYVKILLNQLETMKYGHNLPTTFYK